MDPIEPFQNRTGAGIDPLTLSSSEGSTAWKCPSNIAVVKYWGKREPQLPMNPSLSITLNDAVTRTHLEFSFVPGSAPEPLQFTFHSEKHPSFQKRIEEYLLTIRELMPVIRYCHLRIRSENSFPHSSGIASSASAMGALALCLLQMEELITGISYGEQRPVIASGLARLGSGSASRSLFPGMALWGASDHWPGSSDANAIAVGSFHRSFLGIRDTILIVEEGTKAVSSSTGHRLMADHPFARQRFAQGKKNAGIMRRILEDGDWEGFLVLAEEEALSLHAMMMTSRPGYLLMKPESLSILRRITAFRDRTGIPAGFTMDAGANVHLLHLEKDAEKVEEFVRTELLPFCGNGNPIRDRMGNGPEML